MERIEKMSSETSLPYNGLAVGLVVLLAVGVSACGGEEAGQKSCSSNLDCEVGYACGADGTCVQKPCDEVPGEGCGEKDLICLETSEYPDGVCSRPECQDASDCDEPGAVCVEGKCKTEECSDDTDCPDGESCNAFGQCTAGADTGTVTNDVGVDSGTDGGGTSDGTAEVGGDGGSCRTKKECPPTQGSDADKWSSEFCACVECTSDSHCTKSGEVCRGGVCRPKCTKKCDSAKGGQTCPSEKPFCISDCCVECIGKTDCMDGKVCVDGVCKSAPEDCTQGSCPKDHTCNTSTGTCEKKSSGQSCSRSSPNCPTGEVCNTQTGKCEPVQGGSSCGQCGSNCKCPGNLTCNQQLFVCTGCMPDQSFPPTDSDCPTQNKICFQGLCF